MEVFEALLKRRSCREFTNQEICDDDIKKLLEAGMSGPSACNKRPWEFYVIKDKEIQEKLKSASRYSNFNSTLIIIVAGNRKKALTEKENDFWIQDCSSAAMNILLEATNLGLGTCWCGLFPMVTPPKRVKEILDLPEEIVPLALIHLGYPLKESEPRTQYDSKKVHFFD